MLLAQEEQRERGSAFLQGVGGGGLEYFCEIP